MSTVFEEASSSQFRLSPDGDVQLMDARVTDPVAFAHITDLHWPPPSANWDEVNWEYQATSSYGSLRSLQTPLRQLQEELSAMLDEIQARGADFVLFGGDNTDCYHPQTARLLLTLCQERGLPAYFVMGNHDLGDVNDCLDGVITQEYDRELWSRYARKIMTEDWQMPGLYYSFERKGVRFIILATWNVLLTEPWDDQLASVYDEEEVDWLIKQLEWDGPIVAVQHVPFNPVTSTYQPEAWRGVESTVHEDDQGQRVRLALGNCPNLLGIIVGHKHILGPREDPLGSTWQFMTETSSESEGAYRYFNIASSQR